MSGCEGSAISFSDIDIALRLPPPLHRFTRKFNKFSPINFKAFNLICTKC